MRIWMVAWLSWSLAMVVYPQVQVLWEVDDERVPESGYVLYVPVLLQVDQADEVYVAGATSYRDTDFLLIKHGADGTRLWSQVWNGESDLPYVYSSENLDSLQLDPQGNILLGGTSEPIRQRQRRNESVVLKYAPDGELLWERHRENCLGGLVAVDHAGNVLVEAIVDRSYIRKYAPDGTLLWERIIQPYTGFFVKTDGQGYSWYAGGAYHVRVRRLAPDGTRLWDWFYWGGGWDFTTGLWVDSNSNAYVSAMSAAQNPDGTIGSYDIVLFKLNPEGQVIWQARYGSPEWTDWQFWGLASEALTVDERSGAVYLVVNVGRWAVARNPVQRMLLKFRASDGQLEWAAPIEMPARRIRKVMAVTVDKQGRIYVLGYTAEVQPHGEGGDDEVDMRFVLTRFDGSGRQHGVYHHPVFFYPHGLQVRDDKVYVWGNWWGIYVGKMRAVAVRSEGDVTGDGCVSDGDLARVLLRFGTNTSQADVNGDGVVNEVDLRIVLENFGLGCGN